MRSKITHILMLTAWLLATGVQWDVMQVLAWGRMFANNARVLPLRDAWELTFDASAMCGVCHVVEDARKDETRKPPASAPGAAKEPLVFQITAGIVIMAPAGQPWIVREPDLVAHERAAPPTPPPRGLA